MNTIETYDDKVVRLFLAGFALFASAALTLAGPWLPPIPWLHGCLPFACRTP